jgi:hypothetical protein
MHVTYYTNVSRYIPHEELDIANCRHSCDVLMGAAKLLALKQNQNVFVLYDASVCKISGFNFLFEI